MASQYDNRPNIRNEQFIQDSVPTFNFSGTNIFLNKSGITSHYGYAISGKTIFDIGNELTSLQIGCSSCASGGASIAIGDLTMSTDNKAIAIGQKACALKTNSIAIGYNNVSCAVGSNIIGGFDNIIYSGNTCASLIGTNNYQLLDTPTNYSCTVVVPNLAILCTPSGSGGYLCYNSTTKKIEQTSGGMVSSVERLTKSISQSHSFVVGNVVGFSGGTYNKPIADGTYDGEVLGIVSKCYNANCFDITIAGYVTGLTSLSTSTTYFLSDQTPGIITSIEPTGDTHISKAVLVADSSTSGYVLPYPGYIITTGSTGGSGTSGITWCGSTVDGIATFVDSTHVCSEPSLIYDGLNLQFANGQTRCISMENAPASGSSGLRIYGASMIASGGNAGSIGIIGGLSTYCSAANGGHVCLHGGTGCACASFGVAYGGCVDIQGGMGYFSGATGGATGGHVCICGGCGKPLINTNGTGGNVYIWGGCGRSNGGNVNISAGRAVSGTGGYVALSACTVALLACSSSCVELYYNGSAKFKTINTGVCAIGRLDVSNDVQLLTNGGGIIMCSPNGTKYCLTVTDGGALTVTAI